MENKNINQNNHKNQNNSMKGYPWHHTEIPNSSVKEKKETGNPTAKESLKNPTEEKPKKETVIQEHPQNNASVDKRTEKTSSAEESPKEKKTQPVSSFTTEHIKAIVVNVLKVLLPAAACAIVIVAIISYMSTNKQEDAKEAVTYNVEPLKENAFADVNALMRKFYTALASGDMDTVKKLRDYNVDMDLLTYEKKSEFIEAYENVNCYTKAGIVENSYFVYVTYELKIKDIETRAPGLNAFYVYTDTEGGLIIDGRMDDNIEAAFKIVTSQDDVVDLYNKVNVGYSQAIASDQALEGYLDELPGQIKTSVGEALAQLEMENNSASEGTAPETETETESSEQPKTPETETVIPLQNQAVNQIVRATDTVNVRSSDSEEADRIGKVQPGTELTRIEERINGWSKVIFEGNEAYIKSNYLEVVSTDAGAETNTVTLGSVTANTNVNIRSAASQDAEKVGTAQAGVSYELLEEQGEWYKINYQGQAAYVKAEFFKK